MAGRRGYCHKKPSDSGSLQTDTATELSNLDGIKKLLTVTIGSAFAGTSKIVTNDDGLNWLDTLKDTNGRYLLKPNMDPTSPLKYQLAVGARMFLWR